MLQAKNKKLWFRVMMVILLLFTGNNILVAQNNGPKAFVKEPVKDAGDITNDKKLTHDFIISNDGNAPLLITNVMAACGCTATSYDKIIAPGKTGKVHAVTNISTFTGTVSKDITVFTNDPANPIIQLTSKGKVIPAGN